MRKPNINFYKGGIFNRKTQLRELSIAHEKFSAVRVEQYEVLLKMILFNWIVGSPIK